MDIIESEQVLSKPLTLNDEIKYFAEKLPFWAQFISEKLFSAQLITDQDIDIAYTLFLEEAGLKEKEMRKEARITFKSPNISYLDYKSDLFLSKLCNVEGVNALSEDQFIEFSPNVTVIYGVNGSGKTGYIRLLKKAFFSRAEESILKNVNIKDGHKDVKADFDFISGGKQYLLQYPNDSTKPEFLQFSVFDGKSVLKHLDGKNEFEFRPAALNIFLGLSNAFKKIEEKLASDISTKNTPMDYASLFDGESDIKSILMGLTAKTKIEELKVHLSYSEEDRLYKKELEEQKAQLLTLKKDKEISALEEKKVLVNELKDTINKNNNYFTDEYLIKIENEIEDCVSKENISQKSGINSIQSELFDHIGSPEWKAFIEAAKHFSEIQVNEYQKDNEHCLFCHQPLSKEARALIIKSFEYIKSTTEKEAKDAQILLVKEQAIFEKIEFNLLLPNNVLTVWLDSNHKQELGNIMIAISEQQKLSEDIVSDIKGKKIVRSRAYQVDITSLDKIIIDIEAKITELREKEPTTEIQKLSKIIAYLEHKEKLEQHIDRIELYINDIKWVAAANKAKRQLSTRMITEKEKELSSKYFSQAYINTFNDECKELNGNFGIEINHTGSSGTSFRQLKLKNHNPSEILSEGEQKVISLADFLSEMEHSGVNKGIIFDDPVNSLDEERKSNIAERLVHESNKRQVVVFTHDLVFVSSIVSACSMVQVNLKCHWIEKLDGKPGVIWLNNTPSYEKSYKTIGKAQQYYEDAKKDGPEQRENDIKNGFAALRTSYESLVVFDLFKGVVQRFAERVSIDSLKDVNFDVAIRDEIMDSFYKCCSFMEGHSHSDKYAYKKPTLDNLREEIDRYSQIKKKLKDSKKRAG